MSQPWYKKASVQTGVVAGIFLITASIVTGMFNGTKMDTGGISISDIVLRYNNDVRSQSFGGDRAICFVDFRVKNSSSFEVSISKVRLHLLEIQQTLSKHETHEAFQGATHIYDGKDVLLLKKVGDDLLIPISQVVPAGSTDRFGVCLFDLATTATKSLTLQPSLLTSKGEIVGEAINVQFDSHSKLGIKRNGTKSSSCRDFFSGLYFI
jgi:hypothetical protein